MMNDKPEDKSEDKSEDKPEDKQEDKSVEEKEVKHSAPKEDLKQDSGDKDDAMNKFTSWIKENPVASIVIAIIIILILWAIF